MWLWRCSLLGFISFPASAVHISFSSNSSRELQRSWSRAATFMQNSYHLWDLSEMIQGPLLGSRGVQQHSRRVLLFISYVYVFFFFFFLQKPLVKNRRGLVIIAGTSWCLLCAGIWICILSCDISYSHVSISILWMRKLRLNYMKSLVQVALLISDRPGHWALGHSHTWCKLLKKCHA